MLKSIQNFLEFIIENWTAIVVIAAVIFLIVNRIVNFFKKSKEERVAAAKAAIKQTILKWVTDAEVDYIEWTKAGSIKRSQVIQKIYTDYPILAQVVDQDSLITFIDSAIDEALKTARQIVEDSIDVIEPPTMIEAEVV